MTTLFVITALLIAVMPASATDSQEITFRGCTVNRETDTEIGEAQMVVIVTPETFTVEGVTYVGVGFEFKNLGPLASSIARIYFDDGSLLDLALIENGEGVSFSQGASPGELPGRGCVIPPFQTTADFLAGANPSPSENGVGPGEWVKIFFTLQDDEEDGQKTYADVITDLRTGALRIGIHVIGFASRGSETFVNDGSTAVTLSCFSASQDRSGAKIHWSTGTELNNAGFNLYRSGTLAGPQAKITAKLLAAKAEAVSGVDYSFNDAPGYGTFYYWLEDVELSGRTTLHGPISVTIQSPFRQPLFRPALPGSG